MTPYQYRRVEKKLLPVYRFWHNTKNVMLDLLQVIGVFIGLVVLPCMLYTILSFFV